MSTMVLLLIAALAWATVFTAAWARCTVQLEREHLMLEEPEEDFAP